MKYYSVHDRTSIENHETLKDIIVTSSLASHLVYSKIF